MKICPKEGCGQPHEKLGKFCSRKCANSRGPRSEETKQKIRIKVKGRSSSLSDREVLKDRMKRYWADVKSGKRPRVCIRKRIYGPAKNQIPLEDILSGKTSCASNYDLKIRLIAAGIKENKCERVGCAVGQNWLGKSIVCALHHTDGDRRNNKLVNLEMLCPNCHSQTGNFGWKNSSKHKSKMVDMV